MCSGVRILCVSAFSVRVIIIRVYASLSLCRCKQLCGLFVHFSGFWAALFHFSSRNGFQSWCAECTSVFSKALFVCMCL